MQKKLEKQNLLHFVLLKCFYWAIS